MLCRIVNGLQPCPAPHFLSDEERVKTADLARSRGVGVFSLEPRCQGLPASQKKTFVCTCWVVPWG